MIKSSHQHTQIHIWDWRNIIECVRRVICPILVVTKAGACFIIEENEKANGPWGFSNPSPTPHQTVMVFSVSILYYVLRVCVTKVSKLILLLLVCYLLRRIMLYLAFRTRKCGNNVCNQTYVIYWSIWLLLRVLKLKW